MKKPLHYFKRMTTWPILFLLMSLPGHSKQVSQKQTETIAYRFLSGTTRSAHQPLNLIYTAQTESKTRSAGDALFHVYNVGEPGNGFIIVAADDCAFPVLGYSTKGTFSPDKLPEGLESLLKGYRKEITEGILQGVATHPAWEQNLSRGNILIEPLVTAQWGQQYPWNYQCPALSGYPLPCGCVATAMSQVMYYWKHPIAGQGSHHYTSITHGFKLSADFSQPFLWNKMRDKYQESEKLSQEEANAVARLVLQCGIATEMNYSPGGSTAINLNAASALANYFGYRSDTPVYYESNRYPDVDAWKTIMRQELDARRPLLYDSFGHAYICDGYDSNDFFHFNFGSEGEIDGFFQLHTGDNPYMTAAVHNMTVGIAPIGTEVINHRSPSATARDFYFYCPNNTINSGQEVYASVNIDFSPQYLITPFHKTGIALVDENGEIQHITGEKDVAKEYWRSGEQMFGYIYPVNHSDRINTYKLIPAVSTDGEQWQLVSIDNPPVINLKPIVNGNTGLSFNNRGLEETEIPVNYTKVLNFHIPNDGPEGFFGNIRIEILSGTEIIQSQTYRERYINTGGSQYYQMEAKFPTSGTYSIKVSAQKANETKYSELPLADTQKGNTFQVVDHIKQLYLTDFRATKKVRGDFCHPYKGENLPCLIELQNSSVQSTSGILDIYYQDITGAPVSILTEEINVPAGHTYRKEFTFSVPDEDLFEYVLRARICNKEDMDIWYALLNYPSDDAKTIHNISVRTLRRENDIQLKQKGDILINESNMLRVKRIQINQLYIPLERISQRFWGNFIVRLYDASNTMQAETTTPNINNDFEGVNVSLIVPETVSFGTYTLRFFTLLDSSGEEKAVLNSDNIPASFTVELVSPEPHLIGDNIEVDGIAYAFDRNTVKLPVGVATPVNYCASNLYNVDYEGELAVFLDIFPNIQVSPAIPVKVDKNRGKIYGTIDVTIPENTVAPLGYYQFKISERVKGSSFYQWLIPDFDTRNFTNMEITSPSGISKAERSVTYIYPTIASDYLHIVSEEALLSLEIYNLTGQLVASPVPMQSVNITSLPSGYYMLRIYSSGRMLTYKFYKK